MRPASHALACCRVACDAVFRVVGRRPLARDGADVRTRGRVRPPQNRPQSSASCQILKPQAARFASERSIQTATGTRSPRCSGGYCPDKRPSSSPVSARHTCHSEPHHCRTGDGSAGSTCPPAQFGAIRATISEQLGFGSSHVLRPCLSGLMFFWLRFEAARGVGVGFFQDLVLRYAAAAARGMHGCACALACSASSE